LGGSAFLNCRQRFFYRSPFADHKRRYSDAIRHFRPFVSGASVRGYVKLQIAHDTMFFHRNALGGDSNTYLPLSEIICFEDSSFGRSNALARHPSLRGVKDKNLFPHLSDIMNKYRMGEFLWWQDENGTKKKEVEVLSATTANLSGINADMIPANSGQVIVLHISSGKLYVSTEPDYFAEGNSFRGVGKRPKRDQRVGSVPKEFDCLFTSYSIEGNYYLVGTNGVVYLAKPKGENELEVTTFWNDPKQSILGVVQDLKTKKVYAFGKDSGILLTSERFYMEFALKARTVSYQLPESLHLELEDVHREAYWAASAIRSKK
jgi:hypothetical protein